MVISGANRVRALLLAAGTGSRLYPLTDDWPSGLARNPSPDALADQLHSFLKF